MFKNILPLVLLTMIIVSACETQNPENPEKEETIKLKKILVKDQGYIEFNYDGNQVSEMNYTFPSGKTPVYAEFEFRYENDELYEITRTIYPDSITSYPSSKFRYTFDFSDSEVDLTTNYDARTSTINEETTWDFDAEGKLIHQKWDNRNYWDYTDFEWEDGNLIQTQTFRTDIPDSLFRLDTYQYDKQMSYSSLFPKEFYTTPHP